MAPLDRRRNALLQRAIDLLSGYQRVASSRLHGALLGLLPVGEVQLLPSLTGNSAAYYRPRIDWIKADLRHQHDSVEQRLFDGRQRIIAVRESTPAFADFNNHELIDTGNEYLFVYMRNCPTQPDDRMLVVANFDAAPQPLTLSDLGNRGRFEMGGLQDLCSAASPSLVKKQLVVPAFRFYWLTDGRLR